LNKLIEISYNRRETVLNTWDDKKNTIKPNLKLSDEEILKQIKNCDTSVDNNKNKYFSAIPNYDDSDSDINSDKSNNISTSDSDSE
jgi:hypothetical protein